MKATLKDVAAAANVGLSTASYVLNGSGLHKVSAQTRERILAVAQKLEYTPNAIARGLRSGKSYLIGVVLPGIDYSFMPEIIAGIDRALAVHGYNMLLCTINSAEELQQKLQILKQKQVDGIVLKVGSRQWLKNITAVIGKKLPCVLVTMPDCNGFPGVHVDPELLAENLLSYLYRHDHRKIAVVYQKSRTPWQSCALGIIDRYPGMEILELDGGSPGWFDDFFARRKDFSAVLACDPLAVQIIREANLRQVQIPNELSVLGVDGLEIASYTIPGLTTAVQPRAEQGSAAAELLLQWINSGVKPTGIKLKSEICERESVALCKQVPGAYLPEKL